MNTPDNAPNDPSPKVLEAKLMSTKPHWLVSFNRVLLASTVIVGVLLSQKDLANNLPPKAAAAAASLFAILYALERGIIAIGDLFDDGEVNGSFPPKATLALLIIGALCCLFFSGCQGQRIPGSFSAGVSGQREDGTVWHAEYTVPLDELGDKGKAAANVQPLK